MTKYRHPAAEDVPKLKSLWHEVFGDSIEEIDRFFETWFLPELTLTCGDCDAMAFLMEVGHYNRARCGMLYAVAVRPEKRRSHIGSGIVKEMLKVGHEYGFDIVVAHPAEASLFDFYEKEAGLAAGFTVKERVELFSDAPTMPAASDVSPEEYRGIREILLMPTEHIDMSEKSLAWFTSYGGRLLAVGRFACAACEYIDGELFIRELISPVVPEAEVIDAIRGVMKSDTLHITTPTWFDGGGAPFGVADYPVTDGFFGLAFE